MIVSNAHKATIAGGSVGWAGFATMALQWLDNYFNPTTVQVLANQYTENLRIIAESCIK